MRQIAADPSVEYVEVDKLNKPLLTPNDTRYSEQWGYSGTYGIKANQAWDVTNGSGAVVAVLDTGITNHSDLNANVLPGYDFIIDTAVSNDGNGRDSDASDPGDWVSANQCGGSHAAQGSSWHGTHVAGTIAAVTNNAKGVAGVAYGAKIVPVRVLGTCGGYDSDIADAIIWASGGTVSGVPANANPAEVINLSLGGSGACGTTTQTAINGAVGRGTTLVIAAGNDNANVSNASPANCNNVIAVASITSTGARSSFSNYGALIDIAAPGSNILSTLNTGTTTPGSETYASYNGTSMATPHVAGVVALMQSVATTPKTPAQVETLIKGNVTAFPSTPSQPIGPGILNAKAVVDATNGTTPPPTATPLTNGVAVTGVSGAAGSDKLYSLDVPAGATGLKFVTTGGTGDADLYVKFGSAPTTTSVRLQVRRQQQRRDLQHRHRADRHVLRAGARLRGVLGPVADRQLHHRRWRHADLQQHRRLHDQRQRHGRQPDHGVRPHRQRTEQRLGDGHHRAHLPGRPEGGPGRAGRLALQHPQPHRRQRRQRQQDGHAEPVERSAQRHLEVARQRQRRRRHRLHQQLERHVLNREGESVNDHPGSGRGRRWTHGWVHAVADSVTGGTHETSVGIGSLNP